MVGGFTHQHPHSGRRNMENWCCSSSVSKTQSKGMSQSVAVYREAGNEVHRLQPSQGGERILFGIPNPSGRSLVSRLILYPSMWRKGKEQFLENNRPYWEPRTIQPKDVKVQNRLKIHDPLKNNLIANCQSSMTGQALPFSNYGNVYKKYFP